jgi:hypothetical protein
MIARSRGTSYFGALCFYLFSVFVSIHSVFLFYNMARQVVYYFSHVLNIGGVHNSNNSNKVGCGSAAVCSCCLISFDQQTSGKFGPFCAAYCSAAVSNLFLGCQNYHHFPRICSQSLTPSLTPNAQSCKLLSNNDFSGSGTQKSH